MCGVAVSPARAPALRAGALKGDVDMKWFVVRGGLLAALLLLTGIPARAELSLMLVNGTPFEVNWLSMRTDEGGMGSSANVVPGNRITLNDGNASAVQGLTVIAGPRRFTFEDMRLSGPEHILTLALRDGGVPVLLPGDPSSGSPGATARPVQDKSIDVDAGPIWDNDHARKRCPEVLAAWMEEHPGRQAVWTGHWTTTVEGEMSVCNLRVASAGGDAPTSLPATGAFSGTASPLIPQGTPSVDLARVLAARSMTALRNLGVREADPPFDGEFLLSVNFAGTTWAARISPENGVFSDAVADACPLRTVTLSAIVENRELGDTLAALSRMGYRPLFSYVKEGAAMKVTEAVRFWDKETMPDQAAAEAALADACGAAFSAADPVALETLLLPREAWDAAAGGQNPAAPVMRLRVTSSRTLTLIWMPDGSALIEAIRE